MGCIHVEEEGIYGKEMRACTRKCDSSDNGVIIIDDNLVQIDLIIDEKLLFKNVTWNYNFKAS